MCFNCTSISPMKSLKVFWVKRTFHKVSTRPQLCKPSANPIFRLRSIFFTTVFNSTFFFLPFFFFIWVLAELGNQLLHATCEGPSKIHNNNFFFTQKIVSFVYQGQCGSCYTFAATGVLEFLRCAATNELVIMRYIFILFKDNRI